MESIWVNCFQSNVSNSKASSRTYLGLSLRHWWASMVLPKVRCCCHLYHLNVWSDQLIFWATSLSTGLNQPFQHTFMTLSYSPDWWLMTGVCIFTTGAERRRVRVLSRAGNCRSGSLSSEDRALLATFLSDIWFYLCCTVLVLVL